MTRVDSAGVEISAPCGRGGQCRSGTYQHGMARVDNAGSKVNVKLKM